MSKKTMKHIYDPNDIELRKWCVSTAMGWPNAPVYAAVAGGLGQGMVQSGPRNPITDAEAIYNWIKPKS